MSNRWHAITCRTCGAVLASGLLPPGCDLTTMYLEAFREAHRASDRCAAERIDLAPCSEADVVARVQADLDAGARP